MIDGSKWKDRVDLIIYHLDEDPGPGQKYQPIIGDTVVINQKKKIEGVTTDSFFRALEEVGKQQDDKKSNGRKE